MATLQNEKQNLHKYFENFHFSFYKIHPFTIKAKKKKLKINLIRVQRESTVINFDFFLFAENFVDLLLCPRNSGRSKR